MLKKIIVPSNFSLDSLLTVKSFVENCTKNDVYDFHLVRGYHLSSSITDLLFFSKHQVLNSILNEEFKDGCQVLRNKYPSKIKSIKTDLFTGESLNAFCNYINAIGFDTYLVDCNYSFNPEEKRSIDLLPFLSKTSLQQLKTEWQASFKNHSNRTISDLLFTHLSPK
jgi:hypothetical protein